MEPVTIVIPVATLGIMFRAVFQQNNPFVVRSSKSTQTEKLKIYISKASSFSFNPKLNRLSRYLLTKITLKKIKIFYNAIK